MEKSRRRSVNVIVADDHQLFRKGVIGVLKRIGFVMERTILQSARHVFIIIDSLSLLNLDITEN